MPIARLMPLIPALLLLACAPNPPVLRATKPTSAETTATCRALRELPAPSQPVYDYPELTGQFKAADTAATSSRAVTQCAV
jgi:hypothetical protein